MISSRRLSPRRASLWGGGRLAALPVVLLVLAGCTGVPASTYCYQITGATVHVVDTGMTVAGDLYRTGHIPEATKVKLVAAHDVYRPAAQTAVAACKVVDSKGDADRIFAELQKAADKLLETLVAVGVIR